MTADIPLWTIILISYVPLVCMMGVQLYILNRVLRNTEKNKMLEVKTQTDRNILPLKLQAYERLALLCERMDIPSLIARIRTKNMSSGDLQAAMMVTIQQEFEHNVTQQIYVSDKLWQLMSLTKQEVFNQMNQVMIKTSFVENGDIYSQALIEHFGTKQNDPLSNAKLAVKKEARLYL